MRRSTLRAGGLALLIGGIAALAWALLSGEAEIALVLIFPVIYGAGGIAALGILMLFAGLVLLSLSLSFAASREESAGQRCAGPEERREFGGVVLIGPIPIVFGSARALKGSRALIALAILSTIALVLFLLTLLR